MKEWKDLDLHESEWSRKGKKAPLLGSGASLFFQVTLPTFIISITFMYAFKFIVNALLGYPLPSL